MHIIYICFFFTQEYEKVHSLAEMIETLVCSRNSALKMAEREISALEPALVVFIFCFSIKKKSIKLQLLTRALGTPPYVSRS